MYYLFEQIDRRSGRTPTLRRKVIAENCHLSADTVKTAIRRLVHEGFVVGIESHYSCREGGTVYELPKAVIALLKSDRKRLEMHTAMEAPQGVEAVAPKTLNPGSKSTLVSSSFNKTTTNNRRTADDVFEHLVERLNIDEQFGLGCYDLQTAFAVSPCDLDEFCLSVEHLAFYLRDSSNQTFNNPKAWAIKKLRSGFMPRPANFVSWAEQQEEAKRTAHRVEAERLKEVQRAMFNQEFESWHQQQPDEALEAIMKTRSAGFRMGPVPAPMRQSMLRQHFAELQGKSHLLEVGD